MPKMFFELGHSERTGNTAMLKIEFDFGKKPAMSSDEIANKVIDHILPQLKAGYTKGELEEPEEVDENE